MAQKITSNAAQSAATNSSTAELLEALQKAWAENAELKKQLAEKDRELKKALRAAIKWQGKLEKRQKAAAASISTSQPKTAQTKPAVKPTKTEPIVQSTKNDTITSPAPRSSDRAITAPDTEPAKMNAWMYKREVLIPNLISNIEEHYGPAWQKQWSQDVEEKLAKMEPQNARNFINALDLHKSYYESNSKEFADVVDEWPNTAEELYHKIMEDGHDNNKEQRN